MKRDAQCGHWSVVEKVNQKKVTTGCKLKKMKKRLKVDCFYCSIWKSDGNFFHHFFQTKKNNWFSWDCKMESVLENLILLKWFLF